MKSFPVILLLWLATSSLGLAQMAPAIEWEEALGGSQYDSALECAQTSDGGYIAIGSSQSDDGHVTGNHGMADGWVVKLDAFGAIQWQRSFGGTGSDSMKAIQQTTDGGYICAGYTASNNGDVSGNHGLMDVWVVKLDAGGVVLWQKCLGGSGYDLTYDIAQTADGGYLVSTQTDSNDGDVSINHGLHDAWIVKLNAAGSIMWQTSIGGSGYDYLLSILTLEDGKFILAGGTTSNDGDVSGNHGGYDYWVIELDSLGGIIWQTLVGGSANELAGGLAQAGDGGFLLSGYTLSNDGDVSGNHGGSDTWVVKLDASGGLIWQRCFGGTLNENGAALAQCADGGMVVLGYSDSDDDDVSGNHGGRDSWLLKLNGMGDLQWQLPLGGSQMEMGSDVHQTADGGYVVSNLSRSIDGDVSLNQGAEDAWVVKLDAEQVGVQEFQALDHTLWPNPANDQLMITSRLPQALSLVSITEVSGRTVLTTAMSGTTLACDVSSLNSGTYMITIRSALGIWNSRFLIER